VLHDVRTAVMINMYNQNEDNSTYATLPPGDHTESVANHRVTGETLPPPLTSTSISLSKSAKQYQHHQQHQVDSPAVVLPLIDNFTTYNESVWSYADDSEGVVLFVWQNLHSRMPLVPTP
jgi:hypothetical protein